MSLAISDLFMHNVMYIEMLNASHKKNGSATGFLYGFCNREDGSVLCLVTNQHVLSKCDYIKLSFTSATESGDPDIGNLIEVELSTKDSIFHPTSSIDLAILPLGGAIKAINNAGKRVFYARFSSENIPSEDEWKHFSAMENVFMAGFPKGFRDDVNNQPIIRKGITATHPALNFKGSPEFLVDMPCYEGCSGSPVFICDEGLIFDKRNRSVSAGSKVRLLGVQYAIPSQYVIGQLATVPTAGAKDVPVIPLYLNLGFIIKSSELMVFEDILSAQLKLASAAK